MSHKIKQQLTDRAREIGLAAIGFAAASPMQRAEGRTADRIEKGYMGHYGFKEPSDAGRFTDPSAILADAKTVIACALSYNDGIDPPRRQPGDLSGVIARFARGADYHQELSSRLKQLSNFLAEIAPDAISVVTVDTGPLLDRAAAELTGMGWYGRNACIFVPNYGSWVVLGEIITSLEIEPDPPTDFHKCGTCTTCIAACPTGAIVNQFEINLNRCISHLTQMGGFIPHELRPKMGTYVYGCDICQDVCPQNESALLSPLPAGHLSSTIELAWLLHIDKKSFGDTLRQSTAGWIGRNRLRRNAAIALGNIAEENAVPELCAVLDDDSAIVREAAVWALCRIGGIDAMQAAETAWKHELHQDVKDKMLQSLCLKNPQFSGK